MSNTVVIRFLFAGLLLLAGCQMHTGVGISGASPNAKMLAVQTAEQLPQGDLGFKISPLDVLQIDVYPRTLGNTPQRAEYATEIRLELSFRDQQYRITRGDLMRLEIPDEPGKTTDVGVLPDGNIRLPRLGREIGAVGRTLSGLADAINREYTVLFKQPKVILNFQRSGLEDLQKISGTYPVDRDGMLVLPKLGAIPALGKSSKEIADLVSSMAFKEYHNHIDVAASFNSIAGKPTDSRTTAEAAQYFHGQVKVSPEGTLFVPEAGQFHATGMLLSTLTEAMQKTFDRIYQNPVDVRISLQDSASLTVFVGGEVKTPGRYPIQSAQTLMQLLSSAGWVTDRADINRVSLLHAATENNYQIYRSNLAEVIEGKAVLRQDLKLSPGDIVVVPKAGIVDTDIWIDQYIRKLLPMDINLTHIVR